VLAQAFSPDQRQLALRGPAPRAAPSIGFAEPSLPLRRSAVMVDPAMHDQDVVSASHRPHGETLAQGRDAGMIVACVYR
jgi:hypothetical protein